MEIGPFLNNHLPAVEPNGQYLWSIQETFTGINITLPTHLAPYPGTNKLICVAKEGRVFLFDDTPGATQPSTFLDLRGTVFTSSDSGMTWLVFHPQFGQSGSPNSNYVYITYKWKPSGGNGSEAYWRLSRFTVFEQSGKPVADPASEQILIQQYDRQQWHDSGCMMFGPDGYLYVGIGDEGGENDQYNNGQKINERLFSGILRIDVDQKPENHAIRRQPTQRTMPVGWPDSFTAHYSIPADNPFNDASGANLEEFYAIGLRNPYRFAHDPVSNRTWIGDVGQDSREEIDILAAGGNYGWPFREGSIARPTGPQPPVVPSPLIGTLVEPVWDSPHGSDGCVVGGFVYRGAAHPSLTGKFISVDNVNTRIRAHELVDNIATNQILAVMPSGSIYSGTSTIGRDAAGEPIFVKIDGTGTRGRYFKLVSTPVIPLTRVGWFRFEDQAASNTSGFVSGNPGNATANSVENGVPLLVQDNETSSSANVTFVAGNGLTPTGASPSVAAVRCARSNGAGRPGNSNGDLYSGANLGVLSDFTAELSFRPAAGSLDSGFQTFLGVDGNITSGIHPFRLSRASVADATSFPFTLQPGDLFLNVRTRNPTNSQWTSVAIKLLDAASFTADQWYHLAIVGNTVSGTLTVYSYSPAAGVYSQIGQATGYIGNLQAGQWTVGRGWSNFAAANWVLDTTFDEIRISDGVLPQEKFLYGTVPYQPRISAVDPPALLSQTGAFSNLADLTPSPGVVPYDVNTPLWSDAAEKRRWIAIPNNGVHDSPTEKIAFAAEGNWKFPSGTVFIKHFELPVNDNNPSVLRRLETRFIVIPDSGEPFGFTYKWRADGSDADLLPGGLTEVIEIETAAGGTRQQTWDYPGRLDCRICHNGNAGYVLGVKTHQLNRNLTYPLTGRTGNQLETMASLGWFDNTWRGDLLPWLLKSHTTTDVSASLSERVRSYVDSNCSQCHRPGGVRAFFDARFTTPLEEQGIIHGNLATNYGNSANRVIVPGSPGTSILLQRLGSLTENKMPPLAKHVVDPAAVALVTEWINHLSTGPSVELTTGSPPTGPFILNVRFSQDVTGLDQGDFKLTGATSAGLTGSGSDYALSIVPSGFGVVTVKLPAGSAVNGADIGNHASSLFSRDITDSHLVAWLKLDDGAGSLAADSSSYGNNGGTLVAMSSASWVTGKFGGALAFDTTDQRVTMPNVVGGDFSISFWMKTTAAFPQTESPTSGALIFNADLPGAANDFMVSGTQSSTGVGRISFMTGRSGGSNVSLHGTLPVTDGQWHHIVVTREQGSGQMRIHVNGMLDVSMTGTTTVLNGNPVITVGATSGNPSRSYSGLLDEIHLFSSVLGTGEITALGNGPPPPSPYSLWAGFMLPGLYSLQSADQDIEGDGLSNFGEFAFGGNPLAYEVIPVPSSLTEEGDFILSYRALKPPSGGAGYLVQVSGNLLQWDDATSGITSTVTTDIPGTDYQWITITYEPPPDSGEQLFFRVLATSQP